MTTKELESPFLEAELLSIIPKATTERPRVGAEGASPFMTANEAALRSYDAPNDELEHADQLLEEYAEAHEECEEEFLVEQEFLLETEANSLDAADTLDGEAAQTPFPRVVKTRVEPLLDPTRIQAARSWNAARHRSQSGIRVATLRARLDEYLDSAAIQNAMRGNANLATLTAHEDAVLAVLVHQFQQRIYSNPGQHDGKLGEGTLDALGFVRHRGDALNAVDTRNVRFHVQGNSLAYQRIRQVHRANNRAFSSLGTDVSPETWYCLFVNAPFLGRPFGKGIHVELMRRLRRAEQWLLTQSLYRDMSPVELGTALGIDEDHAGGRTKNNASMHTFGLAVDIGYIKNPWVAGQADSAQRNRKFQEVTRNVSRLLSGVDEAITAAWLSSLGSDASVTTEAAYNELQKRHVALQVYLSLQTDRDRLRTLVERGRNGLRPELIVNRGEKTDDAVARWQRNIRSDRAKLTDALQGSVTRDPDNGFLNINRNLVIALRDHGCLAWGAIDLGGNQSGDMMHFDCRATGVGLALAVERQRTVGAGHRCHGQAAPVQEREQPLATTETKAFLGGQVWTFSARTLPLQIALFCTKASATSRELEVLVYAHGLLTPCEPIPTEPEDLIRKLPFELGKIVDTSGRPMVLVVPFLEWGRLTKRKLGFGFENRRHLLARPANFNAVMAEMLAEVGRARGTVEPQLGKLILAGHSRAYDVIDPLARAWSDPEMSKGALARLSQVWALDTTYGCALDAWLQWLAAKPELSIEVFFKKDSKTDTCGPRLPRAAKKSGGRLRVTHVSERHCDVPVKRLPDLLAGLAIERRLSTEYEDFEETELDETELDETELDETELDETELDAFAEDTTGSEFHDEGEHDPPIDYPKRTHHGADFDFESLIEAETFTAGAGDRFVVLVSGYNYFAKTDDYGVLARNRARVIVGKAAFSSDDTLVFVWFSVADGKVYTNRRRGGAWKLRESKDWTAIDEFEFAAGSRQAFAFEAIDKAKHYAGSNSFRQNEANTVMSIVDVYRFISQLGHHRKAVLLEFSILSHGYWNGPVLVNTNDGTGTHTGARDPSDKDGRGGKDFTAPNHDSAQLKDIKDAFHADGVSWIWGCFVTKAARAIIQGVADSRAKKTPWGKRVRGVSGALYRTDGTTADNLEFRFSLGRSTIEGFSRDWDSTFFPTGVTHFDKTFAEIKAFAKKHSDETYFRALAVGIGKPCLGPPLGTSSNYASKDPYRPGTPVVHWVERGKARPSPESGREANYSASINFCVKTMGMPEDPEGRGYIHYSP